jgi:hypothetical protein
MPVIKIENCLSESLFEETQSISKKLLNSGQNQFTCNLKLWNENIVLDSFPVLVHTIYDNTKLYGSLRDNILSVVNAQEKIKEKYGELKINGHIMLYYWTRFSYIPWHNDRTYDAALTIYLNDDWDRNYGGYFLYNDENENEIKAICPNRNLGVIQYNQVHHCTTPVNFNGGIRYTLQVFFEKT